MPPECYIPPTVPGPRGKVANSGFWAVQPQAGLGGKCAALAARACLGGSLRGVPASWGLPGRWPWRACERGRPACSCAARGLGQLGVWLGQTLLWELGSKAGH